MPPSLAMLVLAGGLASRVVAAATSRLVSSALLPSPLYEPVSCFSEASEPGDGCVPSAGSGRCGRFILDDFLAPDEVSTLLTMTKRAMDTRSLIRGPGKAGPTIVDFNSGFMRDLRLQQIYKPLYSKSDPSKLLLPAVNFTKHELALYGDVFSRIGQKIVSVFNLSSKLYFTAPTFVTRIRGGQDIGWEAKNVHDEYYHAHADGVNTPHYHYSGLVYLSTLGEDFEGGRFRFWKTKPDWADTEKDDGVHSSFSSNAGDDQGEQEEVIVEPRAGRLLLFSSGEENWHRVDKVVRGDRFVLSLWFTCHASHEFSTFLDGKAHTAFAADDGGAQRTLGTLAGLDGTNGRRSESDKVEL